MGLHRSAATSAGREPLWKLLPEATCGISHVSCVVTKSSQAAGAPLLADWQQAALSEILLSRPCCAPGGLGAAGFRISARALPCCSGEHRLPGPET